MRQHGFTLLEVLVAMVIVSIGLVGLAGLMMTSAKNNQSAYQRSQASWLAYDIMDRMRANRTLAQSGTYNIAFRTAPSSGNTFVDQDLNQWKTELATALTTGDGSVLVQGNVAIVTVSWDDSRGLGLLGSGGYAGNASQSITLQTQL